MIGSDETSAYFFSATPHRLLTCFQSFLSRRHFYASARKVLSHSFPKNRTSKRERFLASKRGKIRCSASWFGRIGIRAFEGAARPVRRLNDSTHSIALALEPLIRS